MAPQKPNSDQDKMKRPIAPQGWKVVEWNYRGERHQDYVIGKGESELIILALERVRDECNVWLELSAGSPDGSIKDYFSVGRAGNRYESPPLEPVIETASQGVNYALMIAREYMDKPIDKIPGAREGADKRLNEGLRELLKQKIPGQLITPVGTISFRRKKK